MGTEYGYGILPLIVTIRERQVFLSSPDCCTGVADGVITLEGIGQVLPLLETTRISYRAT